MRRMKSNYDKAEELFRGISVGKIPIVVLDERWHEMFRYIQKPRLVKKLEDEVNSLLKKQGQINNDLSEVKKIKNKLMQKIVDNMEDSGDEKTVDASQKLILECNEKLAKLEDEQMAVPYKLKNANEQLLVAGMEQAYLELGRRRAEAESLSAEIEAARARLREQLIQKQELEEQNTIIYSDMHDILGAELMEIFDKKYGQKE